MWKKLLGFAVLATNMIVASCHGFLAVPASRNLLSQGQHYCPHCLANGGPGYTYTGGRKWTSAGGVMWNPKKNAKHGVCGGLTGDTSGDFEAGGKYVTKKISGTYAAGQVITLQVSMTAPHGGRWSFGVCKVPDGASDAEERKVVTQQCMDSNKLIIVDPKNGGKGTPYWWVGKLPNGMYALQAKLPDNIECKRCVLQWHWESGNSCTIPGTPKEYQMTDSKDSCEGATNMEEFWNCADITILPKGTPVPPPPKPPKPSPEEAKQQAAQDASLRAARQQQANELRRQAESMPKGPIRDLVMGQVKTLESIAKGGAGEGFTNFFKYAPRYRDVLRIGLSTGEALLALATSIAAIIMPSALTVGLTGLVIAWIAAAKARLVRTWKQPAWPWQVSDDMDNELKVRMMLLKMPSTPSEPPLQFRRRCAEYST